MGLGALATAVGGPQLGLGWKPLLIVLLIIVLFALLLFGGYYLWQRRRARRQREQFTSAIEQQTAAAPRAISDPNKRASLDKVRQKFQTGLQEFKSRGKDIYQLPWYPIIGESGSGKSEAIRHSGIDFPPGMQDELQGSGGTVNMDWWFTNRGIILDTAGSMLFSESRAGEAPEWGEFLRLLKKSRPQCPINGLFLVLSIESLIKDSSDRIAQKASVLAQQLDLIQRTLDVRFPVYLLVTKCDLLTGFREFFDNIDDPLLQHQMFGWSNPDPLDTPFRPDLVEQHLKVMAGKIQRRRLAMLRDSSSAPQYGDTQQFYKSGAGVGTKRRLDDADAMFALPESVMRLAPRLRRYLETIFVAGEWSSKPVFLRGIYFTSSMREGKALDEAIAFATGLSLDRLPEDRKWEKNRAFFLRDLFHEKVFRESGLVTRASNTLKMLRQRQFLIFSTAGAALLLMLVFAGFAYVSLKQNVLKQSAYWEAGTKEWNQGEWSPGSLIQPGAESTFRFLYAGTNTMNLPGKPTVVEYHKLLKKFADEGLSVNWIFKPVSWFSKVKDLPEAQRALFEGGVLRPLVFQTRIKMQKQAPDPQFPAAVARHQAALLALMQLEADRLSEKGLGETNQNQKAEGYLRSFVSYLTDSDWQVDTNLSGLLAATYPAQKIAAKHWPSAALLGGDDLTNNAAIRIGLENLRAANQTTETKINSEVQKLNELADALSSYQKLENDWLSRQSGWCDTLNNELTLAHEKAGQRFQTVLLSTNFPAGSLTNMEARYRLLEETASSAASGSFQAIRQQVPPALQTQGIFGQIKTQLDQFASDAARTVKNNFQSRESLVRELDANSILPVNKQAAYEQRWTLYSSACDLSNLRVDVDQSIIGKVWAKYDTLKSGVGQFQSRLADYKEPAPRAAAVVETCNRIAADSEQKLKVTFAENYAKLVHDKLAELSSYSGWTMVTISNTENWLTIIGNDLRSAPEEQRKGLAPVSAELTNSVQKILAGIHLELKTRIGFPLFLNSTKNMTLADMQAVKELSNGLLKSLQNPLWQMDPSGAESLRKACGDYVSVVNALLDEQGSPVKWELWFSKETKYEVRSRYRDMDLLFAGAPSSAKLQTADSTMKFGEGNAKQVLTLTIYKTRGISEGRREIEFGPDWGLIRLLIKQNAERLKDGAVWRLGVVPDEADPSGTLMFEARLQGQGSSLPEIGKWPKQ